MSDRGAEERPHVTIWWTPDCGHQHVVTDPVQAIDFSHCPDGVTHDD